MRARCGAAGSRLRSRATRAGHLQSGRERRKVGANSITVTSRRAKRSWSFQLQIRDLGLPRRTCRTCSTDIGVGATRTTKGPAWPANSYGIVKAHGGPHVGREHRRRREPPSTFQSHAGGPTPVTIRRTWSHTVATYAGSRPANAVSFRPTPESLHDGGGCVAGAAAPASYLSARRAAHESNIRDTQNNGGAGRH